MLIKVGLIKKCRFASLLAVLCLSNLSGLLMAEQTTKNVTVEVLSIVDHLALDAVRQGVQDELKTSGYVQGKNLRWVYQSAQGNAGTAAQIARKFVGDKPDVIVAIATSAAQAVVAATQTIPVVYSAVYAPVPAQLVPTLGASGTNVTGVSHAFPLEKQIALIRRVVPNAKRVGIVYSPGEVNSLVVVEALRKLLPTMGMTLIEAPAPITSNISAATQSLVGKVDVIYTNADNNVVSAYESLVKVANEAKIPLLSAETEQVQRGAIAALGMNFYDVGRQTGKLVVRILRGEKPGNIASVVGGVPELFVNLGAAKRQGAVVPADLVKQAKKVIP